VTFAVSPESYDRFMGRYSGPLAAAFASFGGVEPGARVVDVGCGPGALTGELVARVGAGNVSAADPSEAFVAAVHARHPDVDARVAAAEALPFDDATFDAALAQLVVHFMSEPVAGIVEMSRVTRPGGVVAACVWDFENDRAPISTFWRAVRDLELDAPGEAHLAGARAGHLVGLFTAAGLADVEGGVVETRVDHTGFDEWWEPFTLGVGPAGAFTATLDTEVLEAVRARCEELVPPPPFAITAAAWAARGRVSPSATR